MIIYRVLTNLWSLSSSLLLASQEYLSVYQVIPGTKFFVRKNTPDRYIVWEIFKRHEYDMIPISPTDVVVDIGANIGVFSVYASNKAPRGKIVSYEPIRDNFSLLVKNIKLNSKSNIIPHNKAVAKTKSIRVHIDPINPGGNSQYLGNKHFEEVPAVTLEEIFKENKLSKIDVLKIDAEGSEYDIILNTPKHVFSKIKRIILEFHDYLPHGHTHTELLTFLDSCGFNTKVFGGFLRLSFLKSGVITAWKSHTPKSSL